MQSSAADMKGGYDMLLSGKMQIVRELDAAQDKAEEECAADTQKRART